MMQFKNKKKKNKQPGNGDAGERVRGGDEPVDGGGGNRVEGGENAHVGRHPDHPDVPPLEHRRHGEGNHHGAGEQVGRRHGDDVVGVVEHGGVAAAGAAGGLGEACEEDGEVGGGGEEAEEGEEQGENVQAAAAPGGYLRPQGGVVG